MVVEVDLSLLPCWVASGYLAIYKKQVISKVSRSLQKVLKFSRMKDDGCRCISVVLTSSICLCNDLQKKVISMVSRALQKVARHFRHSTEEVELVLEFDLPLLFCRVASVYVTIYKKKNKSIFKVSRVLRMLGNIFREERESCRVVKVALFHHSVCLPSFQFGFCNWKKLNFGRSKLRRRKRKYKFGEEIWLWVMIKNISNWK